MWRHQMMALHRLQYLEVMALVDSIRPRSADFRISIPIVSKIALLVAATIAICFLRRPDQLTDPAIWIEDGTYILKAYAERGLRSFFEPVAGYYIVVPKVIAIAAFYIDIVRAPAIEAWLTVLFTAAVLVAVAQSPTWLPYPFLCALLTLGLPIEPENYTLSLYTLWWAGLLVALAVLWDSSRGYQSLRALLVLIGGLSSPIILASAPLLWVRAAFERTFAAIGIAVLSTALAAFQGRAIWHGAYKSGFGQINLWNVQEAFDRFLGLYFVGAFTNDIGRAANLGFIVAIFLCLLIWHVRDRLDWRFGFVVLLWVAAVGLSASRIRVELLHPFISARYFFYADIFLAWGCVWLAAVSTYPVRIGLAAAYGAALLSAGSRLQQRHVPYNWKSHILNCGASTGDYTLPIMYMAGTSETMWKLTLSGDQCRFMIAHSLVRRWRQ